MAKSWYPVIDYSLCTDCGACVAFCENGVYDKEKNPSPLVKTPVDCIDHCHGCGNICPQGAIAYVGDDTGWTPPYGKTGEDDPCCGCGEGSECGCGDDIAAGTDEKLVVDYLYLDLNTCQRCIGTDDVLREAVEAVRSALKAGGYHAAVNMIEIADAELAEKHSFLSSPTIRVNGRDICLEIRENICGSCGDLSGSATECRLFIWEGKEYEVPPKAMLVRALLKTIFVPETQAGSEEPYLLPENLKTFFEGKNRKSECGCGGKCC